KARRDEGITKLEILSFLSSCFLRSFVSSWRIGPQSNRKCHRMVEAVKNYLKDPQWRKQHRWRKAIWTTMSRLGLSGAHALPMNRRWIDIHRRKMPLKNLDPALAGMKIVQISDLHYSPVVW